MCRRLAKKHDVHPATVLSMFDGSRDNFSIEIELEVKEIDETWRVRATDIIETATNNFNSRRQKNNTTGYKGVYYNKNIKKFCARSKNMGTRTYLGDFNTAEEAYEAYCAYGRIHHGEFFNDGNK